MSRVPLWHFAVIVAICILTFANTLSGAFVWDDEIQIVKNPNLRSVENIPAAFTQPFWGFATPGEPNRTNYYRPMQTILYTMAYGWGGLDPVPNHVISIALHVVASLFVYLICVQLAMAGSLALLVAGLFAAHPIHSEAVAWIAATPDLACGAFYFAAYWAFLKSEWGAATGWLVLSAGLFLLALFSKEMAITLPGLVLLSTFRPAVSEMKHSQRMRMLFPYMLAALVYLLIRVSALGFLASDENQMNASLFDWITLGVQVFGRYIWFAMIPYPLMAYHQVPLHLVDRVVPGVVALVGIGIVSTLVWRGRQRLPEIAFWYVAFAMLLVPVFYFKGVYTGVMADRYLYIPSLAAVIVMGAMLTSLVPKYAVWLGWGLVAIFAVGSMARNRDWRDAEHLYTVTLEQNPEIAHLQINLAQILLSRGDDANAARRLNSALESLKSFQYIAHPDEFYRVHIGLGAILARTKNFPQAREHLETAQKLIPEGDWPHLYLGGIAMEADNDLPKAIEEFRTAIRLGPLNEVARDYLGIALFNQGKLAEAKAAFEEALKINPQFKDAQTHLALVNQSLQQ